MKSFSTYIILFFFPIALIGQIEDINRDSINSSIQIINIPPVSVEAKKIRAASTGSSSQRWSTTDIQ